ncbi:MAG: hypothetical protein ACQETE_16300 [Bacteroidota bacterium]
MKKYHAKSLHWLTVLVILPIMTTGCYTQFNLSVPEDYQSEFYDGHNSGFEYRDYQVYNYWNSTWFNAQPAYQAELFTFHQMAFHNRLPWLGNVYPDYIWELMETYWFGSARNYRLAYAGFFRLYRSQHNLNEQGMDSPAIVSDQSVMASVSYSASVIDRAGINRVGRIHHRSGTFNATRVERMETISLTNKNSATNGMIHGSQDATRSPRLGVSNRPVQGELLRNGKRSHKGRDARSSGTRKNRSRSDQ